MKKIKKIWPFEQIDLLEINNYIANRSKEGLSLKKIGSLFAYYEEDVPNKYIYALEYMDNKDKDYRNDYIIQKENEGWEYIYYCNETLIFRKLNISSLQKVDTTLQDIPDFLEINKKNLVHSALEVLTFIISLIIVTKYKELFILLLSVKTSAFIYTAIRYLYFNKNKTYFNAHTSHTYLSTYQLRDLAFFKFVFIAMSNFIFFGIFYITFFKYKAFFLSKIVILFVAFIAIAKLYQWFKESNRSYSDSITLSNKQSFIFSSIIILIISAVLFSFFIISENAPKVDRVKGIPVALLKSNDETHISYYNYGHWTYRYSSGSSVASDSPLSIYPIDQIARFDFDIKKPISIDFPTPPDYFEIRYWSTSEYSKLDSLDKNYKTLDIENKNFLIPEKNTIYCIYAKWNAQYYDGFGYYLFTI